MRSALIILSFALFTPQQTQSAAERPAHIILLRHAEEPTDPDNPHLSAAGVSRAERLVTFITTDPAMSSLGRPVAVFATQTTERGNGQRTQETVAPLARALNVPVQTPFLSKDYRDLARLILSKREYAGKTVLICWTHQEIPKLAAALGVKGRPPKWKRSVYDRVDVISYQRPKPTLSTVRYP